MYDKVTRVIGTVRDSNGVLSKGAVIEAQLMGQMIYSPGVVGNKMYQTESNAFGKFLLDLAPCTLDGTKPNNYYSFKIIDSTTNYYSKIVPETVGKIPVEFDDLQDYVPENLRTPFFGGGSTVLLPPEGDYTGLFSYAPLQGDGTTDTFTVPGKVHMVVLNGIVQNPAADYTNVTTNSVRFLQTPLAGDVILIQYKI
ncbi:MAG: hypothetical protein WC965_02155 [Thiohalomonadaceae bacterium]